MRGWQGQPRKMAGGRILEKKRRSQAADRRAVGCNLVVLKSAFPRSSYKKKKTFSAPPYEQLKVLSVLV
jgi:hypothetical protein